MRVTMRGMRVMICLVSAALLLSAGKPAEGQITFALSACKKIVITRMPGGGADNVVTRECGTRFSADDPYVALLITVRRIADSTDIAVQLLDPADNSVFATRFQIAVPAGTIYDSYWTFLVLPLAADARALAAENPELLRAALRLPGQPARERPGEWTLRLIARGATYPLKFTIVAGAAPPSPAATPAPSPTPAAAPSPTPAPSPSQ